MVSRVKVTIPMGPIKASKYHTYIKSIAHLRDRQLTKQSRPAMQQQRGPARPSEDRVSTGSVNIWPASGHLSKDSLGTNLGTNDGESC